MNKKLVDTSTVDSPVFGKIPNWTSLSSSDMNNVWTKFSLISGLFSEFPELASVECDHVMMSLHKAFPGFNFLLATKDISKENMRSRILSEFGKYVDISRPPGDYIEFLTDRLVERIVDHHPKISSHSQVSAPAIPLANLGDAELLARYIETKSDESETEINKRVRGRPFIVMNGESIDVSQTMRFFKIARKNDTPRSFKDSNNELITLYRIEEIHEPNRRRILSPFDTRSALFEGYCASCEENIGSLPMETLQFIKIVVDIYGPLSLSDKKLIVKSAIDGTLSKSYVKAQAKFVDLKFANQLPNLVMVESIGTAKNS